MRFVVLFALLSCGGSTQYDCTLGKPGECQAVDIVWRESLKQTTAPPPIVWHSVECTTEWGAPGFFYGGYCSRGFCSTSALWQVDLIWTGGYSDSAFAHELLHSYLLHNFGNNDINHSRDEWKTVLPYLNQKLRESGL